MFGLAIGSCVTAGGFAIGSISGAVLHSVPGPSSYAWPETWTASDVNVLLSPSTSEQILGFLLHGQQEQLSCHDVDFLLLERRLSPSAQVLFLVSSQASQTGEALFFMRSF